VQSVQTGLLSLKPETKAESHTHIHSSRDVLDTVTEEEPDASVHTAQCWTLFHTAVSLVNTLSRFRSQLIDFSGASAVELRLSYSRFFSDTQSSMRIFIDSLPHTSVEDLKTLIDRLDSKEESLRVSHTSKADLKSPVDRFDYKEECLRVLFPTVEAVLAALDHTLKEFAVAAVLAPVKLSLEAVAAMTVSLCVCEWICMRSRVCERECVCMKN